MSGSSAVAASSTTTPARRRGAALTKAIFTATLEELAGSSFSELTFEKIALRSGAGRMSLYRRWSDPAALLRDALADEVTGMSPVSDPNTGSLRATCSHCSRSSPRSSSARTGGRCRCC